jgi:hypothetical protein
MVVGRGGVLLVGEQLLKIRFLRRGLLEDDADTVQNLGRVHAAQVGSIGDAGIDVPAQGNSIAVVDGSENAPRLRRQAGAGDEEGGGCRRQ